MLTVMGSIANGGEAVLPYTVAQILTPDGDVVKTTEPVTVSYISSDVADEVSELMRFVVTDKYGDDNFKNLSMCGKTGTAEVEDGKEPHSWFVGFSQKDSCPVAIVVVVENGGWGSEAAMPIASTIMTEIYNTMS
jgi:peptidoglycan glycosyltransferase